MELFPSGNMPVPEDAIRNERPFKVLSKFPLERLLHGEGSLLRQPPCFDDGLEGPPR